MDPKIHQLLQSGQVVYVSKFKERTEKVGGRLVFESTPDDILNYQTVKNGMTQHTFNIFVLAHSQTQQIKAGDIFCPRTPES